jgi:hypothetical protein
VTTRVVKTQAELDKALADKVDWIEIRSAAGVWLEVTAYGSSTVTAYDSSTVRAYGSSTVTAYDSSTVRAYGSSTVTAYDSSTVRAYGSSTVRAYGSSTVRAYGSSTVTAYDSSTVRATPLVAVHLHNSTVHVTGGVILDHTHVNNFTAAEWCDYHGVEVVDGVATLYKAVNSKWTTDRGTNYAPGSLPSCNDFNDRDECGGGLHFGPSPTHALNYFHEATKFLAVGVLVSELRPITGDTAKAKAPRVVRACAEVDIHGRPVAEVAP